MRKLGLDSLAALVRYAIRNNIVEPDLNRLADLDAQSYSSCE